MSSKVKPPVSLLQARMIEDMTARGLHAKTQVAHIRSCRRFAKWLGRSPDTASPEDVRLFQLHLSASGTSNQTRNMVMSGVKFLFRTTLRRHDLVAEIFYVGEPQKLPPVMSRSTSPWLICRSLQWAAWRSLAPSAISKTPCRLSCFSIARPTRSLPDVRELRRGSSSRSRRPLCAPQFRVLLETCEGAC